MVATMHRLFVALRPPPPIRHQLLAAMGGVPDVRWQDEDQLHLTIRFIGSVERPQAEDVAAAIAHVTGPPMTLSLAGVGRFDRRGRTDTLWAAVSPHDALAGVHARVDRALAQAGVAPDPRAFLPHITLGRLARGAGVEAAVERFLVDRAGLVSAPFTCDALILFESHLGHAGAQYDAIMRVPLDRR